MALTRDQEKALDLIQDKLQAFSEYLSDSQDEKEDLSSELEKVTEIKDNMN